MDFYYGLVVGVIILLGCFGGIVNYFLYEDTNNKFDKYKFIQSIVIGLGASALVPLFLNMISSNLLEQTKGTYSNLLVFAGICLVFSIYSKSVIKALSNKILMQIEERQDRIEKTVDKVIDSQAAPDNTERVFESSDNKYNNVAAYASFDKLLDDNFKNEIEPEDTNEAKIIKAIGNSGYSFRTLRGIETDTKLPNNVVTSILESLIAREFISILPKKDKQYYFLTQNGKIELDKANKIVRGKIEAIDEKDAQKSIYRIILENGKVLLLYAGNGEMDLCKGMAIEAQTVGDGKVSRKYITIKSNNV